MTKNRPLIGTAVFIIKDWKFLIWKRKSNHWEGTWCIPWGHLEFWETIEECVKREALEESWVNIKDVEFLWIRNDISKDKHYVTIFMKSKHDFWEVQLTEFDEFYEWKWIKIDNLPENLFYIFWNFVEENVDLIKSILS